MKRRIIVVGNAQAEVIALALRGLRWIDAHYDVAYRSTSVDTADADILCIQQPGSVPRNPGKGVAPQVIRFPEATLKLLWPLNCVNVYNVPDPPRFTHGRFPYGDAALQNAIAADASSEQVAALYGASLWPDSWPNLDELCDEESRRLRDLDAQCDVQIAEYVLRNFRTQSLFANVDSPRNALLARLAGMLCAHIVGSVSASDAVVEAEKTLQDRSPRDVLAGIEVPVHPAVAARLDLAWYRSDARYNYFDETLLTANEYVERFVEYCSEKRKGGGLVASRQKTLLIYGNCQAEALAAMLRQAAPRHYRVVYGKSFDDPNSQLAEIRAEDAESCGILWEQHDDLKPFPHVGLLPADSVRVVFPSVDFNALWPFTRTNPYAVSRPPHFPFGRFPYADAIILQCLESGMNAEETLRHYEREWARYMPDLERLLILERVRLQQREKRCGIKMSDFIFGSFRAQRLFWTVNHPAGVLLGELANRLIANCAQALHPSDRLRIAEAARQFTQGPGPLDAVSVPIHPKVAEHYGLSWYDANKERFQNWGKETFSYGGYFTALVNDSLAAAMAAIGS